MDYAVLFIYFDFDCGVTGVCVFFLKKKHRHIAVSFAFAFFFLPVFLFCCFYSERNERHEWMS